MEIIHNLLQYILHIDTYLFPFVKEYGVWTYALLFLIIFCETGLVILPFLPGDSLLFAAGSIAGTSGTLNINLLLILLIIASTLGNQINYWIGKWIGPRAFSFDDSWLFKKRYLENAHQFYEKHGGKTIIMARFIPIIRTFVPFVAGISYMNITRYTLYNILSAILWVSSLLLTGYFFGSRPFVQAHFTMVIYAIIVISLLPPVIAFIYRKLCNT